MPDNSNKISHLYVADLSSFRQDLLFKKQAQLNQFFAPFFHRIPPTL